MKNVIFEQISAILAAILNMQMNQIFIISWELQAELHIQISEAYLKNWRL